MKILRGAPSSTDVAEPTLLDPDALAAETDEELRRRRRRHAWKRHRMGYVGAFLVAVSVIGSIAGPWILGIDPNAQELTARFLTPWSRSPDGSTLHILGTDPVGRDVLARMLEGGRASLMVAGFGLVLGGGIGLVLGVLAGYYGGKVDQVIMRFVDAQLALPIFIAAMFVSTLLGGGFINTALTLGIAGWPIYARLIRADVLKIREEEFLEAGIGMGASDFWLVGRHVLPNLISAVAVVASLEMGRLILLESGLSYLGMGMQPPNASWGSMIRTAQAYVFTAPHLSIIPGLVIVWTVLGLNLLGDWIRDILDPQVD